MERTAPRRLSPLARRAQLLDVALELAAGGDVAGISVSDLASAAGVSEGLLYHYFPTKEALVVAAVRRAADDLLADLDSAEGATPAEKLLAGLTAYLDHVEGQPTGWRALLRATSGEVAEIAARVDERSRAIVLDLLGIPVPGEGLIVALAGWEAFERGACAAWLEQGRSLPRPILEQVLVETFFAVLQAAAVDDPTAREALTRLQS